MTRSSSQPLLGDKLTAQEKEDLVAFMRAL
jgi:hypothetical protein